MWVRKPKRCFSVVEEFRLPETSYTVDKFVDVLEESKLLETSYAFDKFVPC